MPRVQRTMLVAAVAAVLLPLAALRPLPAAQEAPPEAPRDAAQEATPEAPRIEIVLSGDLELATSLDELRLEPGAMLRLRERCAELGGGDPCEVADRELVVTASGAGELVFEYTVDGAVAPFDEAASEWADGVLSRARTGRYSRGVALRDPQRVKVVIEPGVVVEPKIVVASPERVEVIVKPHVVIDPEGAEIVIEPEIVMASPERVEVIVRPHVEIDPEGTEIVIEPEIVKVGPRRIEVVVEPEVRVLALAEPYEIAVDADIDTGVSHTVMLRLSEPLEGAPELDTAHEFEPIELSIAREGDDEVTYVARLRGDVELAASVDDLRLGPDGELILEERGVSGSTRVLRVTARADGTPRIEWSVDGEAAEFDAEAREWAERMLARLLEGDLVPHAH